VQQSKQATDKAYEASIDAPAQAPGNP
jgi:hypothetical protein